MAQEIFKVNDTLSFKTNTFITSIFCSSNSFHPINNRMMYQKFMIDDRAANWAQTHLHFHVTPFFIWKEETLLRMQISLLSFQKYLT
jgi:hypothetical protein